MEKIFLFDEYSINKATLQIMNRKGYQCIALTDNPNFFWDTIDAIPQGSVFVLLSHGDGNGPLAVRGDRGRDIDLGEFSRRIRAKGLTLYLLSCHTGLNPCGDYLLRAGLDFAAPVGEAVFKTIGTDIITVYSQDNGRDQAWVGPLSPGRLGKPLQLP